MTQPTHTHDELWSAHDDQALERVVAAARSGDLFGALCGLERAPRAVREQSRRQLRAWSEAVRQSHRTDPLDALRDVLVGEGGLRGDRESYYDIDNSLLSRVIERRRGMPILVTAIWVLTARGAGLVADGIGLPCHFIARVDGRLIDPFSGGETLTVDACRSLVAAMTNGLAWDDRFLAPVPAAAIAERVLRNLTRSAAQDDAWPARATHYRAARMLAALRPDSGRDALALAQLTEAMTTQTMTRDIYADIAQRFDGQPAGALATVKLRMLPSEDTLLN